VRLYWTDKGGWGLQPISGMMPAEEEAYITTKRIPEGVPVYIHGVIIDAKGAMTQVTSEPIAIAGAQTSADPAWLLFE
jgi:hypothetical protein